MASAPIAIRGTKPRPASSKGSTTNPRHPTTRLRPARRGVPSPQNTHLHAANALTSPLLLADSEIRFVGSRHPGVLFGVVLVPGIVFLHIFRTDTFIPYFAQGTAISYGRRPGHREDAFILYGEFELQSFALVVGVDRISRDGGPFFLAPFLRFLSRLRSQGTGKDRR